MDTTPLQRFSSSPQNSYCPSEASSSEYLSPSLVAQQYSLSSLFASGSFCSMEPTQDSDIPLFALDTNQHSSWEHPATTLAPTSLSGGLSTGGPPALPVEYESFGSFTPTVSTTYSPALYSDIPQRPASLPGTHSPSASGSRLSTFPRSSPPLLYSGPPSMTPNSANIYQHGVSTSVHVYGHMGDRQHFQHAQPAPFPQQMNAPSVYGLGNSSGSGSTSGSLPGFLPVDSVTTVTTWRNPAPATEHMYSTSGGSHGRHTPTYTSDPEQRVAQPRRQPRRLTTREEANFQCEVRGCGKLFSRSYNYKAHMETHDEGREYPFPCQVADCDRRFVRKTDLQRHHQSVHVKERKHKCDYCGRLFARKDTLRRHMDDGCSKRFDIGTLDLGAHGMGSAGSGSQSLTQL